MTTDTVIVQDADGRHVRPAIVTPEGERALVDAQLRDMDDDLRYIVFATAADVYSQALTAGQEPSLVEVLSDAMRVMVVGSDAIIEVAPTE